MQTKGLVIDWRPHWRPLGRRSLTLFIERYLCFFAYTTWKQIRNLMHFPSKRKAKLPNVGTSRTVPSGLRPEQLLLLSACCPREGELAINRGQRPRNLGMNGAELRGPQHAK
jgi:hypothetical protein